MHIVQKDYMVYAYVPQTFQIFFKPVLIKEIRKSIFFISFTVTLGTGKMNAKHKFLSCVTLKVTFLSSLIFVSMCDDFTSSNPSDFCQVQ